MDYLWPCLVFVWVAYLWETYLQWRQRRVYRTLLAVPPELEGKIDQNTFDKSRRYQLDKSTFSLVFGLFKELEFLVFILIGAIPYAWHSAGSITAGVGYGEEYEIVQTVVFLLLVLIYSTIVEIPWSVYSTFVLEEKHGFNKQTMGFFIKDKLKMFLLLCLLVPPIGAGLVAVIHWGGEHFYIYAWGFVFIISLIFIMVYHDYIAPLFDKFTPLPEGELRSSIEGLASSLQFPLKKILVVEGSKRSAHSNAYFYGFWKNKRIVLFDTLLEEGLMPKKEGKEKEEEMMREDGKEKEEETMREKGEMMMKEEGEMMKKEGGEMMEEGETRKAKEGNKEEGEGEESEGKEGGVQENKKKEGCSVEEIVAVLAHELGHWKLSHNLKNICVAEVNFFLIFFMFGYFVHQQDVYTSFGFPSSRPTIIGLILVFQLIFIPYFEVFGFLMTQLIRRFEYQADAFARQLKRARALRSALTKLYKDNLAFPVADPLYSAFHLSHPTYIERVRALQDKKQD